MTDLERAESTATGSASNDAGGSPTRGARAVGSGLALVAPIALVLGQSAELQNGLELAVLAALVVLVAVAAGTRRAVGGPGLTVLGIVVAGTDAWLVPQRPDQASTVLLAGLFGVGLGLAHPGRAARAAATSRAVQAAASAGLVLAVVLRVTGSGPALLVLAALLVAAAGATRPDRVRTRARRTGAAVPRLRVAAVGVVVVVVGGGYVGYLGGSTVDAAWFGGGVVHGDRSRGQVALTFDDGPNPSATLQVARILDEHGTKGTFFLVGKAVTARPDLARRLLDDGHVLGNHSYNHDSWAWLDPWYPELAQTDRTIERATGRCPAYYRPPHGQRTPFVRRVADDHHERLVMWDVSAQDWATADANLIARRVLSRVRPGSIILLHDGLDGDVGVDRSVLVRALPMILDGLKAKGLRPVALDQLIGGSASQAC